MIHTQPSPQVDRRLAAPAVGLPVSTRIGHVGLTEGTPIMGNNTQARTFSTEDIEAMLASLTGDDAARVSGAIKAANVKALEAEKAARAQWHATLAPLLSDVVEEVATRTAAKPFNADKPNGSVGWSETSIPLVIEGITYRVHLTVTDVAATAARKSASV